MNDQAIRFRLGIFVLTTLILMAVLITLFGGFPNYFKRASTYTLIFNNAQGAAPGTPVRRSGVKIGEVRTLTLDNDTGKVKVLILVDEEVVIRAGDRPTLVQGFLGSDTAIAFLPPPDVPGQVVDNTPVPPGSTLQGFSQADTGVILQRTADLMAPAQEALVEIRNFIRKLDTVTPDLQTAVKEITEVARTTNRAIPQFTKTADAVTDLAASAKQAFPDLRRVGEEVELAARNWGRVGERVDVLLQTNQDKLTKSFDKAQEALTRVNELLGDENQKLIRDVLRNFRTSSERFDVVLGNTDTLIRETRDTMKRFDSAIVKTGQVLENVDKATKPLAERSASIIKNLDSSMSKLDLLLGDARDMFGAFSKGDGVIQKLITDPSLYRNLNEAAEMLTKILPRVDRAMRDVEIFADKIARHPEALGIGGAVRPSSGLKESPTIMPWHFSPLP